jgi:hypothetical protein
MIRHLKNKVFPQSTNDPYGNALHSLIIEDFYINTVLKQTKYSDPKSLIPFEFQSFSQYGEDGIITEIFNRIGTENEYFVEFGVESGIECNSTLLLFKKWKGLWIEGNPQQKKNLTERFSQLLEEKSLSIEFSFVTKENIESILEAYRVPRELDFLSIDIDYNDLHIWDAIKSYKPRVVAIEYNAIFPPGVEFIVSYDAERSWDGTSHFGASLTSLCKLAELKNYKLVGCCTAGVNAFFVRSDLVSNQFLNPGNDQFHYEPPRYYLFKKDGHPRNPQFIKS